MPLPLARTIRLGWLVIAASLLALLSVSGVDSPIPMLGIALISVPAGLLAAPLAIAVFSFPVRIAGIPSPPAWWVYAVLMLGLGYVQWFVVLPKIAARFRALPEDGNDRGEGRE